MRMAPISVRLKKYLALLTMLAMLCVMAVSAQAEETGRMMYLYTDGLYYEFVDGYICVNGEYVYVQDQLDAGLNQLLPLDESMLAGQGAAQIEELPEESLEIIVTPEFEAPAEEPEEVTPAEEPEEVTPSDEPEEVTPSEEPEEVTPSEEPEEVTPAEEPEEVTPSDEPEEVTPSDEPEEVTPSEEPEEVTPSEEPEEVTPSEEPEEVTPADEPEEVTPSDEPEEVTPSDEPEELPEGELIVAAPPEMNADAQDGETEGSAGDTLAPELKVSIEALYESETPALGDTVTFVSAVAVENGQIESGSLSYQWQYKSGGGEWTDLPGETGDTLSVVLSEDNAGYVYRLIVQALA